MNITNSKYYLFYGCWIHNITSLVPLFSLINVVIDQYFIQTYYLLSANNLGIEVSTYLGTKTNTIVLWK